MRTLTCLDIATLKVGFQLESQLASLVQERYSGFRTPHASTMIQVTEVQSLSPRFGESRFIPEIRYTPSGFEIDQAPHFIIEFDGENNVGTMLYTREPRILSPGVDLGPDLSPLPFGFRRGVGVLFITLLAQRGAPAFHAAALNVHDQGVLAPGDSNTGKSTFFSMFPAAMQLNDEFVVLLESDGELLLYSTPFSESWDVKRVHRAAPLRAVLNLIQSPEIASRPIERATIMKILSHNQVLPFGATKECHTTFSVMAKAAQIAQGEDLLFNLDGERVVQAVESLLKQARRDA